jgi:hypothetical protein
MNLMKTKLSKKETNKELDLQPFSTKLPLLELMVNSCPMEKLKIKKKSPIG